MSLRGTCLLLLMFVCFGASSRADKLKARDLFKRAMAEYKLENYQAAIALFQQGYREEPDPSFLFNIAQSYRLWSKPDQAMKFYKKYLKEPSISERARHEAEEQLKALEQSASYSRPATVASESTNASNEPHTLPQTGDGSMAGSKRDEAPLTTGDNGPSSPPGPERPQLTAPLPAAPPAEKPARSRKWIWGLVGGAAAVVVGACVGIGVAYTLPNDATPPPSDLGDFNVQF